MFLIRFGIVIPYKRSSRYLEIGSRVVRVVRNAIIYMSVKISVLDRVAAAVV